jgi:hypothetical protein
MADISTGIINHTAGRSFDVLVYFTKPHTWQIFWLTTIQLSDLLRNITIQLADLLVNLTIQLADLLVNLTIQLADLLVNLTI